MGCAVIDQVNRENAERKELYVTLVNNVSGNRVDRGRPRFRRSSRSSDRDSPGAIYGISGALSRIAHST